MPPVFNYNDISENQHSEIIEKKDLVDKSRDKFAYSIIGGGNHFKSTLYPEINKLKINKNYAINKNGLSSKFLVDQLGFKKASNSLNDFIKNGSKHVIVATRHDSHYELLSKLIFNNFNILIEKPLCIYKTQLIELKKISQIKEI